MMVLLSMEQMALLLSYQVIATNFKLVEVRNLLKAFVDFGTWPSKQLTSAAIIATSIVVFSSTAFIAVVVKSWRKLTGFIEESLAVDLEFEQALFSFLLELQSGFYKIER